LVLARKVEEKLAGQLELEDVESDPLVAEIFEKVKALLKIKLRYPKMCTLSCTRFAGFPEIRS